MIDLTCCQERKPVGYGTSGLSSAEIAFAAIRTAAINNAASGFQRKSLGRIMFSVCSLWGGQPAKMADPQSDFAVSTSRWKLSFDQPPPLDAELALPHHQFETPRLSRPHPNRARR